MRNGSFRNYQEIASKLVPTWAAVAMQNNRLPRIRKTPQILRPVVVRLDLGLVSTNTAGSVVESRKHYRFIWKAYAAYRASRVV
jgi:hypothetical protein